MPDRILIVDEVATNRIVLKVKLSAASYVVDQASTLTDAARQIADAPPRLVLLSDRTGGSEAALAFCRRLTGAPSTRGIPVIAMGPALKVAGAGPGPSLRLSFLAAGAADHLVRPLDDAALLARIRSVLRHRSRHLAEEAAEYAPAPEPTGAAQAPHVALVGSDRQQLMRWRAALRASWGERISLLDRDGLFTCLRQGDLPEAVVIAAGADSIADLRLIAELKARPLTEDAPILVLADDCGTGSNGEFSIMALDLGASDVLSSGFEPEELALRLAARLKERREGEGARRRLAERLRLAMTDPLTGVMNRRAVFSRLASIAEDAAGSRRPWALMILDLDRFKAINDTWGHSAGDQVLTEVARRLGTNLRKTDVLGRIGGEEFLVALPECRLLQARLAAERLRRAIEAEPVDLPSGTSLYVTVSIGLCMADTGGRAETVEALCDRADRALYAAKARGRNVVTIGRPAA